MYIHFLFISSHIILLESINMFFIFKENLIEALQINFNYKNNSWKIKISFFEVYLIYIYFLFKLFEILLNSVYTLI
jgi:hypothetical protein